MMGNAVVAVAPGFHPTKIEKGTPKWVPFWESEEF
jgi:hypothetical protein